VDEQPRSRKADRAGVERFARDRRHLGEVIGGSRLPVYAALAHHVDSQGTVRQQGSYIDVARAGLQRGKILWESFPVPGQTLGHDRAGNVLDAFH